MFMELQTPVDVSQCFLLFLSSGDSCGGPDPDRDVLRRAELVHGQHPAADLKPRCEGSDGGTVQRVAEYPAEPKHPRTLEPHRPLNQGPWTRHRHCLLHPPPNSRKPWLEGRCSCTETEHLRQTGGGLQVYSLFCCHADTFLCSNFNKGRCSILTPGVFVFRPGNRSSRPERVRLYFGVYLFR